MSKPRMMVEEIDEYDPRILFVARHMRSEDARELLTATGKDPEPGLLASVSSSARAFIVLSERSPETWTPVALFGVCKSPHAGAGVAWFLSTDLKPRECAIVLRVSPAWLDVLSKGYLVLHNLLDKRNEGHFRWCVAVGFKSTGEHIVNGYPFIHIIRHV